MQACIAISFLLKHSKYLASSSQVTTFPFSHQQKPPSPRWLQLKHKNANFIRWIPPPQLTCKQKEAESFISSILLLQTPFIHAYIFLLLSLSLSLDRSISFLLKINRFTMYSQMGCYYVIYMSIFYDDDVIYT